MYGQKQIFSCLMIVMLISILNFYKSILKKDKDHRQYAESMKRKQLEEQLIEKENAEYEAGLKAAVPETPLAADTTAYKRRHEQLISKMLEYKDLCYDIHALIFKPMEYDKIALIMTKSSVVAVRNVSAQIQFEGNKQTDRIKIGRVGSGGCGDNSDSTGNPRIPSSPSTKQRGKIMDKISESSASIIYVVVFILLVSLGKAAFDLSKKLKELAKTKTLTEDELLRRCSLQEYSLIKHKQKNSSKALEPFLKKSVITHQRSLDSGAKVTQQQQHDFSRRMSTNPQDYSNGSGITTEPGTPTKPGKLLAGRPAPLLRRCSVPIFANQNTGIGKTRRPSMDSFSEDESSPENKRRVRMIHRH